MTDKDFKKLTDKKKEFAKKFVKDLKKKYGSMTQEQFQKWLEV